MMSSCNSSHEFCVGRKGGGEGIKRRGSESEGGCKGGEGAFFSEVVGNGGEVGRKI